MAKRFVDLLPDRTYKEGMQALAWLTRDRLAVLAGLLGPPLFCLVLVPFRASIANTDAALLLVVVIVAVAALGNRAGGWLAAVSAGLWFDFFLTRPYQRLSITSRTDAETTVLLLVVGVAVTELAVRARTEHARAGEQAGYLQGIHVAAEVVARGGSPTELVARVSEQLAAILGLQTCHFHYGTGLGNPRLGHDGNVTWGGTRWDVDNDGLPLDHETELLVSAGGRFWGRFLMTPMPGARPSLDQRQTAVSLADQVGAALNDYRAEQD